MNMTVLREEDTKTKRAEPGWSSWSRVQCSLLGPPCDAPWHSDNVLQLDTTVSIRGFLSMSLFWSCHFHLWCQRVPCMPARLDPLGLMQSLVALLDLTCHKARLTPRKHPTSPHEQPRITPSFLARATNAKRVGSLGVLAPPVHFQYRAFHGRWKSGGGHVPLTIGHVISKVTAWIEPPRVRQRKQERCVDGGWI